MTQIAAHPPDTLACLEVWGGNEPVDTALQVPGLDVWVYAVPFENAVAGGDVHFVSSCGTGRIARLMVADVAGHGAGVSETARTLRSLIRRYMNHIDQRRFVTAMNEAFTALVQTGRFATAVVTTYFSPTGEFALCNAGHPRPLAFSRAKNSWQFLDAESVQGAEIENIPLGIVGDAAYEQFKITLARDDLVLFYTDSLVEAVCRDGSLMGEERLLELLSSITADEPAHQNPHLLAKLNVLVCAILNDDVTILLLRCTGRSPGAGFFRRLGAQMKFLGQIATFQRNIPWPEWSKRNMLGALATKTVR